MPTQQEMAAAYVAQVEEKITQLKAQLQALEGHLQECKNELKEEEEND